MLELGFKLRSPVPVQRRVTYKCATVPLWVTISFCPYGLLVQFGAVFLAITKKLTTGSGLQMVFSQHDLDTW